jgi:hypothetical protein
VVYLGDEDGDVAALSGDGTITVTGDGNYRDGVNYSISIKLNQDLPLQPTGFIFSQGLDYSGTFTSAGHAAPQMVNGNPVIGYFGGGANTLFLSSSGPPDPLILVATPDWSIYVNSSGGGPNGGPSFNFGATLKQFDTGPGQNFGVTADGTIYAIPGGG